MYNMCYINKHVGDFVKLLWIFIPIYHGIYCILFGCRIETDWSSMRCRVARGQSELKPANGYTHNIVHRCYRGRWGQVSDRTRPVLRDRSNSWPANEKETKNATVPRACLMCVYIYIYRYARASCGKKKENRTVQEQPFVIKCRKSLVRRRNKTHS